MTRGEEVGEKVMVTYESENTINGKHVILFVTPQSYNHLSCIKSLGVKDETYKSEENDNKDT